MWGAGDAVAERWYASGCRTLDDVRRFARTHFTRERCVLGMGGSFTQPLVARVSGALAAGLPTASHERTPAPQPAPLVGRPVVLIDNPSAIGSSISMGVPISARRGTREFVALWIANSWLGEHRNSGSHLYQVIREERGINYGNYSYIDSVKTAEKVFVENVDGTLETIAQDVKIQVEWTKDAVKSYRLLGYENRDIADEDFRNDKRDAGEVGAGHAVTALYEVELTS